MANIDPILWKDKVNSPELLAFLQQYGEEHYLSAEEINELRDTINLLITNSESNDFELKSNKSNFVTDSDSVIKFPTWSAITFWVKEKLNSSISSKTTPVNTDVIFIGDNSDSGKTKKILFSNIINWLNGLFQIKDDQIEVPISSNVQNSWHGKTILFTANCTITVPSTLNNALDFTFRTLAGVTVTWAITSPFVWETTPSNTTEKTVGHFMRRGTTNTIILDV